MSEGQVQEYWGELLTSALLGSDRREPPTPVGAFAHLAVESGGTADVTRFVQQVAACTVALRAGITPLPPVATPPPPAPDLRPCTPLQVGATWRHIVGEWPMLEDEWLRVLASSGYRLSPELVPTLLERHRGHAARHRLVREAAGPLAAWMIEWAPRLACTARSVVAPQALPVTPELEVLCSPTDDELSVDDVVAVLVDGLRSGRYALAHRSVLVNLVCRLPRRVLAAVSTAMRGAADEIGVLGVTHQLAELADLRRRMLDELEPIA